MEGAMLFGPRQTVDISILSHSNQINILTKHRLSGHCLAIETGRHKKNMAAMRHASVSAVQRSCTFKQSAKHSHQSVIATPQNGKMNTPKLMLFQSPVVDST